MNDMEKQYAKVTWSNFKKCTGCGDFFKELNYLSDSPHPVCNDCLARRQGYRASGSYVKVPADVIAKVKQRLADEKFSAFYLYGRKSTARDGTVWNCEAVIPWGYDNIGRPRFSPRDSVRQILALGEMDCIGTLISIPSLKEPPSAGNLTALGLTNTPLVMLIDCNEPVIAHAVTREGGRTEDVIIAVEGE